MHSASNVMHALSKCSFTMAMKYIVKIMQNIEVFYLDLHVSYSVTGFYLAAWTPYALVSMWVAFGDKTRVPELLYSTLAFACKSSFVFNPYFYVMKTKPYR